MSIHNEYPSGSPNASQLAMLAELHRFDRGGEVVLWTLDTSHLGGGISRWTNGVNELMQPIVFQGVAYLPAPVEGKEFAWVGDGTLPRPKLSIGNADGAVTILLESLGGDLVGSKVVRLRVPSKYLDAVNFVDGNPQADPNAHYPPERWRIKRKVSENWSVVSFELGSSLELPGVKIPRGLITSRTCTYPQYKGMGCGWVPNGQFYDRQQQPCAAAQDDCGRTLADCKVRFGDNAVLPIRMFPSSAAARR